MKWLLLWLAFTGNGSAGTVEFPTKEACLKARTEILAAMSYKPDFTSSYRFLGCINSQTGELAQ